MHFYANQSNKQHCNYAVEVQNAAAYLGNRRHGLSSRSPGLRDQTNQISHGVGLEIWVVVVSEKSACAVNLKKTTSRRHAGGDRHQSDVVRNPRTASGGRIQESDDLVGKQAVCPVVIPPGKYVNRSKGNTERIPSSGIENRRHVSISGQPSEP